MDGFANSLQVDYRQLITDAKRSEGFSSQISGFFSGPDNPAVKEAAERAILKVRSFNGPHVLQRIRESQDILRPFLIACETKNAKLIITSLGAIQKLLANDAVAPGKVEVILSALLQVEKLNDEGVQLKVLQSALTLLQSNLDIEKEVDVGATLGICFRLLSSRGTHSVLSTAGATVRQGVAVVFERLEAQCQQLDSALPDDSSLRPESTATGKHLLEDLCDLASGGSAKWLKVSHLARGFVLDLLDLVLTNHSKTFQVLPELQALLEDRVCPFLAERLSDAFLVDSTQMVDSAETKQLLRLVTTLLQSLHTAIPRCTASLLYAVLKGASTSGTLSQRIQALKVFQALCGNAKLIFFLFENHDSKGQSLEQFVVKDMVECFVETSLSYVKLVDQEDHTLTYLASLFSSKVGVHGESFHDGTFSVSMSTAEEAGGVLAMLAVDCILAFTSALDILSDQVILPAATSDEESCGEVEGQDERTLLHKATLFAQLVDANWKPLLSVLYEVLTRAEGEAIVLELVKGYQRMIQACGAIGASESLVSETLRDRNIKARDGFLSSLCEFTLSTEKDVWIPTPSKGAPDTVAGANVVTSPPSLKEAIAGRFGRSTSGPVLGGGSGRDAPPVDADARILTPKNVQCMRALFNCAHRLCSSLGTSWAIVLSNLVSLDRILQSPHTTTQEISTSTDANLTRLSADLMILQAAANQLFESTCHLSTEAVLSMMSSLRDISTRSMSALALRPSHVRLFALERLVEILLANTHRIQDLWGIFLTHLLEVVNTAKDPNRNMPVQVRAAGMEALDRAIIGIMGSTKPMSRLSSPSKEGRARGQSPFTEQDGAAIERMVLLPLEEVFKQAREIDVRLGVLRIVMHCVQQHGDCITIGWETLLRLLREVPSRDETDALALAFQSVQLMCSEYLPSLSDAMQTSCIQVAAMYASQTTDVNISLTAIGLLWNTADLFAMNMDTQEDTKSDGANESQIDGLPSQPESVNEELLQCLFNSLHKVAADSRPEVRNSAVRTLFAVIATTGERLQPETWEACLWGLLFPLLNETFHMAATSSRDEAEAAELGKLRGQSVKMLVHHSRNSAQKQWDETLVLVLTGMGRLLRTYLPILASLPRMDKGWQEIMQMVESTLVSGRKELALAAINTVLAVLNSQSACDALSPVMWKRAVAVFTSGAKVAATQSQVIPLSARTELVKALGTLYQFGPSRFDQEDARALLKWMVVMLRAPHAPEDGKLGPGVLPPMQKVALSAVEGIAPQLGPHYPKLCSMLLDQLILLLPEQPSNPWCILSKEEHEALRAETELGQEGAVTPILQERVTGLLVALYKQHAPWQVRASRFVPLVTALGNCMLTRWRRHGEVAHAGDEGVLWRSSAHALMAVVNAGLPAVNIAFVNADTSDPPDEVWSAVEVAFGGFFLGPSFVDSRVSTLRGDGDLPEAQPAEGFRDCAGDPFEADDHSSRTEQLSDDMELEASVLDTLTDGVLTGALHASENSKRRLIQLVELGVMRGSNRLQSASATGGSDAHTASEASSGFPHLCLRKLFVLCSRGVEAQGAHGTMLEVACLTLPVLISCCSSILGEYVEDESALALDQSLPRWRHDLVMCVLEVVASLKVAPSVVDYAVGQNHRLVHLLGACRQSKSSAQESTHLLLLYPALIRAISVKDVRIRDNLIGVLEVIGSELGMDYAPLPL